MKKVFKKLKKIDETGDVALKEDSGRPRSLCTEKTLS